MLANVSKLPTKLPAIDPYEGAPPKAHDIAPTSYSSSMRVAKPISYNLTRPGTDTLPNSEDYTSG